MVHKWYLAWQRGRKVEATEGTGPCWPGALPEQGILGLGHSQHLKILQVQPEQLCMLLASKNSVPQARGHLTNHAESGNNVPGVDNIEWNKSYQRSFHPLKSCLSSQNLQKPTREKVPESLRSKNHEGQVKGHSSM